MAITICHLYGYTHDITGRLQSGIDVSAKLLGGPYFTEDGFLTANYARTQTDTEGRFDLDLIPSSLLLSGLNAVGTGQYFVSICDLGILAYIPDQDQIDLKDLIVSGGGIPPELGITWAPVDAFYVLTKEDPSLINSQVILTSINQLNQLSGISANVNAINLNILVSGIGANADALHRHSIGIEGVTNHNMLTNLDYAHAGHIGFEEEIANGTIGQFFRGDKIWTNVLEEDFIIATEGKGLKIKEGTNAKQGIVSLVNGEAVINTNIVTSNSRIFLTSQDDYTIGALRVSGISPGISFIICSTNILDTGVIAWEIFEPA